MASSSSVAAAVTSDQGERAEERALTGLLSDDTLLHMMRRLSTRELLSSLALVCHRWRRLCRSFAVYELVPSPLSPSAGPWGYMSRKKLLKLAVTHASTLERVNLIGLENLKSKDVIALCQSLPKLQDLSIVSCPALMTQDFKLIVSHLPTQLISFDIHSDIFASVQRVRPACIDDRVVEDLYRQCPHLQKLDLDTCSYITPRCLDGLLHTCQSLTSLDLDSNRLSWPEVAKVFSSCKSLCHFSLVSAMLVSVSDSNNEGENLSEFYQDHSRSVAKSSKSKAVFIGSGALSGVEMPKDLTSIRLYSSPHRAVGLDHSPMLEMFQSSGHQIQQLHAQGMFNTSWQTISLWCRNLKMLDLSHASLYSFSLTGVEEIVLCGLIRVLKKLERVALPSATDRILTELGQFCSNLREIHLKMGCRARGNRHIQKKAVTDRGIVAIAEGCPALRVLTLSGCEKVTISSSRALAFHCRQLQVLILHESTQFNDAAVMAFLPRLSSSLIFLDLVGCHITQSTLQAVRHYAEVTTLRVLAIGASLWCRSQSVIGDIHTCNPRLKVRRGSGIVWAGFYHGKWFD